MYKQWCQKRFGYNINLREIFSYIPFNYTIDKYNIIIYCVARTDPYCNLLIIFLRLFIASYIKALTVYRYIVKVCVENMVIMACFIRTRTREILTRQTLLPLLAGYRCIMMASSYLKRDNSCTANNYLLGL